MLDFSELEAETSGAFAAKARLDPKTDTVISKLKPGTYCEPYLVSYGWQIVMLDSVRKDSVALRRILVRVKQGGEALAALRDSVRSFTEKAAATNFDTIARQYGLPVIRSRPIVGGDPNLGGLNIDSPSQLTGWARRAKSNEAIDRPLRGPAGYYVFQLGEITPAGFQDFEKVKPAVTWKVRQEQERKRWLAKAQEALDAVKAGKTLEQYAQENPGVEIQSEEYAGLADARMRKGAEFAGAVSALAAGDKYGVVEAPWGAFVLRCDERTDAPQLQPDKYLEQRRQQVAQDLMQTMLKEPEVKDYRDGLAY
jgi:parvulin-like peptidyl-prolyl isomerase